MFIVLYVQGAIKVHIWKTCLSTELEITDITYECDSKASIAFSCFLFLTEKKSSQEEVFFLYLWMAFQSTAYHKAHL